MGIIAVFAVPAEEFALGEALAADPEMTIELERVVPADQELLPFFWAYNEDFEAFEEAAEELLAIERLTVLEREGNVGLFQAEWTDWISEFLRIIAESEATIIEATGTADEWSFGLRFPDRETLREFQDACDERGVEISLLRLHRVTSIEEATLATEGADYGLTEKQRETLVVAFREGYFDDPREVSLEELSEMFDISPRAVSQRLRRGVYNLVGNTVTFDG